MLRFLLKWKGFWIWENKIWWMWMKGLLFVIWKGSEGFQFSKLLPFWNRVFSPVSSSSFSSKTPAFSAKPRENTLRANAISNLRKQSLKEENLECWTGRLLMTPSHLKASNHWMSFFSFILQEIKALSKGNAEGQQQSLKYKLLTPNLSFPQILQLYLATEPLLPPWKW